MKAAQLKLKQWQLNRLIIRHLAMPGKIASSYKWKAAENTVSLVINLRGAVEVQPAGHDKPILLPADTCNLFYSPLAEGNVTNRDTFNEMIVLQWEAPFFTELMNQCNLQRLPFALAVQAAQPAVLLGTSLPIGLQLGRLAGEIAALPVDEKYRPLMLQAKWPEMLLYILDLYDKSGTKKRIHCKTAYDAERLEFARNYLLQHVSNPPGLTELARLAGINLLKLKMGFKEVYGNTVFGYLNDYRMEQAQLQIKEGNKTLTRIAFDLGFSSLPHFSAAYKKKFGRAPGKGKK
ncbi:MAG TPA: AraC family transcriptional regulator [Chitinophagales bacterium]|nr:AraC family transcriptional regulator [Chitinophagales bacterium]